MTHKLRFGDIVTLGPKTPRHVPRDNYEIVRWLPSDARGPQYQIRSLRDGHQRIVHEADLRKISC
jgi:hypothetical protein